MGYALVGEEGELVEIDDPRALAERAAIGMHQYAHKGWSLFTVLNVPERAPQRRDAPLLGRNRAYVEGMRLQAMAVLGGTIDYWRVYETGVAATAVNYEEEGIVMGGFHAERYVTTMHSLFRLHSLLAHARLVGQQTPEVQQMLVRLDWRDINGRLLLLWKPTDPFCDGVPADPKFAKTIALPWAELRDRYFDSLRRVAGALFGAFPAGHLGPVDARLTKPFVERELARFEQPTLRLFED